MRLGYCRVSTDDQNSDLQIDALKKAGCRANKIYTDKISGSKAERPGLDALLKSLRKGDVVVVWRLDRLARSLKDLLAIVEQIKEAGANFVSLTESFDTSTPSGELIFNIFGSIAQFERQIIIERTKAGLKAARARGRKGGRKKALSPQQIKSAKKMLTSNDYTIGEIAEHFGINRSTLYRNIDVAAIPIRKVA